MEDVKPLFIMVAGPNGSGKSTLINKLQAEGIELGSYLCPDIAVQSVVCVKGMTDVARYRQAQQITDQQRLQHLAQMKPHVIESVFSHPSKLEYLKQARQAGFEVELLYIGLCDPELNIGRVQYRVSQGGHDVPHDKIVARYRRSMDQLPAAITLADYVTVYDNSTADGHKTLLEFEQGSVVEQYLPAEEMPEWVRTRLSAHLS